MIADEKIDKIFQKNLVYLIGILYIYQKNYMDQYKSEPIILFPYDFSEISDKAIDHLGNIARILNYEIEVLNILDGNTRSYMRTNGINKKQLSEKIQALSEEISHKYSIPVFYKVQNTSIKKISKVSYREKSSLILIGIDQPRRRASKIMKVVVKSSSPVMVIQKREDYKPYKNILFPLDDFVGSRQKSGWALKIAKETGAKIHIYSVNPDVLPLKDKVYKQYKIIDQVEHFFAKNHVSCNTVIAEGKFKDYGDNILKFAETIQADLYVIMSHPKSVFSVVDPVDYNIIFNPTKTAVLCVHPRDLFVGGGFS